MKKLLKTILTTTALAMVLGAGVAVGAHQEAKVEKAEATVTQDSDFYFVGSTTGWANGTRLYKDSDNDNKGQLLNVSMTAGDTFKFKKETTWDGALGWDALNGGGGTAKPAFKAAAKDGNIEVNVTGTYNFYINNSSNIYVELANATNIYVQVQDWANTYVYAFDETTKSGTKFEPLGGWPGTKVSSITAGTNFNGSLGGIAKMTILYHTMGNMKLIVNNNSGSQSGNQTLGSDYYYTKAGSAGSASDGAQAKVVFDIESAIEGTVNKSVCQVSKSTASSLVSSYDTLSSKTKVNASTYWTWDKDIGDSKANHTYLELVEQLRNVSNGVYGSTRVGLGSLLEDKSTTATLAVVIVTVVSLTAVGGFFLLKKKKEIK